MNEDTIYAVRDRHGLRPLSYAKSKDGYVISSETCALKLWEFMKVEWNRRNGDCSKGIVKH